MGGIISWGSDLYGQCDLPPTTNAIAVAAGEYHGLVLLAGINPSPRLLNPLLQGARFSTLIQMLNRKACALGVKSSLTASNWSEQTPTAGNGALRLRADPSATNSPRFYRMRQW